MTRAIVVGVHLPSVSPDEHASSMAELGRLVSTLGHQVAHQLSQKREQISAASVIGEGKLKELARLCGKTDEDDSSDQDEAAESTTNALSLIAVNHEITPSQARNLEKATGIPVLDRTGVIVEIFHRNAKTRQARLQVEIARLRYTAPRVRESSFGKERQQGRGAGEAALELDKRKVRDRIKELEEELEKIAKEQDTRREARREARRVSLVGYTNAGKSSLMRALTGSQVLVEDKLFATLDTTVRALTPEPKPRILISDTVGFIKDLPHDLVASFKSTLDEAREATLVLQVIDGSDPDYASQMQVTREVLAELGAATPQLVFNKVDRLDEEARAVLARRFPDAWFTSAYVPADVAELRARIIAQFESTYVRTVLRIPFSAQALVSQLHEETRVESETYDELGCVIAAHSDPTTLAKYAKFVLTTSEASGSPPHDQP
jgi:GTPase